MIEIQNLKAFIGICLFAFISCTPKKTEGENVFNVLTIQLERSTKVIKQMTLLYRHSLHSKLMNPICQKERRFGIQELRK